jgi:hypothetical protein
VLDVTWSLLERSEFDATWLQVGGVIELLHADRRRHQLLLQLGATGRTVASGEPMDAHHRGSGIGAPVRLVCRIRSARNALTGLELQGEWQPVAALPGAWVERRAQAYGRLRLFELGGVDLAAEGRYAVRHVQWAAASQPQLPVQEVGLGLTFEPY